MALDIYKPEVTLALDNFRKPKLLSPNESIAQVIINLFLMRPGNIPGLPHIGINIKDYLYRTKSELNVDDLKNKISGQCNELIPSLVTGDISINQVEYQNQAILLVSVGIFDSNTLHVGFKKNEASSSVEYLYEFENAIASLGKQINI